MKPAARLADGQPRTVSFPEKAIKALQLLGFRQ